MSLSAAPVGSDPLAQEQREVLDEIATVVSEINDLKAKQARLFQKARTEKGCTLARIAEAAGLSRQRVLQILDGLEGGPGR